MKFDTGKHDVRAKDEEREIKDLIQEIVTACGWTCKGVAFGKL